MHGEADFFNSLRVHFMRNALAHVPKVQTTMVAVAIRQIFLQPSHAAAVQSWRHVADQLRARWPKLGNCMGDAEADVLAYNLTLDADAPGARDYRLRGNSGGKSVFRPARNFPRFPHPAPRPACARLPDPKRSSGAAARRPWPVPSGRPGGILPGHAAEDGRLLSRNCRARSPRIFAYPRSRSK